MRAKALVLVLGLAAASWALWSNPRPAPAAEPDLANSSAMSQDYRTSQFAARTGWMTYRELWFTHAAR
ncbi:hypothetical protein [Ramlibacter sp. WS9]|uniref:hypothetical protein n=1 Tax=Ramlibacter sp. WS9 TaxID=1882741 RepID=UPI001144F65B|nr:hypothetical protein [Ramlibacter sp. WS9]ROZ79186.1 hypothetical protein EEB15_05820 [Ramlibacter sp. WS9]